MKILNEDDKMLTVRDVSELLHVHPNTLRRWSDEGKILAHTIGTRGDRRYRKIDVDYFLSKMSMGTSRVLKIECLGG